MKNGHLIVNRVKVSELDFSKFTKAAAMTDWEFAAYKAYEISCGGNPEDPVNDTYYLNRDNINTLEDLFGKEFHDKFFCKKNRLLNDYYLDNAYEELKNLKHHIDGLYEEKSRLANEWLILDNATGKKNE